MTDRPAQAQAELQGRSGRIVVRSIGTASAGIVGALRQALPFSEERLAACLYQAPAELVGTIEMGTAEAVAQALRGAGLEVEVVGMDEDFAPGGPDYDVALVLRTFDRLGDVVAEIARLLGVTPDRARHMVNACPAELIGKVSLSTVEAIRRRFEPLGVAVEASHRADARFDMFIAACAQTQRDQARRLLQESGIDPNRAAPDERLPGCLAADLGRETAEALWQRLRRSTLPVRILNRDFQRFDFRLEEAPDTPALSAFMVESAGMPARIAQQIARRTPIVTHHHLRQDEVLRLLERVAALGARGSAHLEAMQRFRLQLARIGDVDSTVRLLEVLGGIDAPQACAMVRSMGTLAEVTTAHQARWLQHELRRVGTDARMLAA